ncbi:hypothetical protein CPB84DRAFT_597698 [Gymnopilus junonius]|uniref:T6SS Phospholipase effector Tle1-like catalytic domain-containing protein n=1 Tax=Gymnopilus junonius TaxID=109634 RepID=A0A9P5NU87_GYMJU|nr:hypothetical protein CPB84DRAFT_597698 [Gymnopilus junonius]
MQPSSSESEPTAVLSASPARAFTDPEGEHLNNILQLAPFKRIAVFCDGTWQDGVTKQRSHYTNVLRLARTINHEDKRLETGSVPQVVFYQSGIGSENNFYSEYIEGTTGDSLADKVEEAYAFLAHNYKPGDEIFIFGFSRGAYTARMVAMLVGEIGVLNRKDMDNFAGIFLDFQKLGKSTDSKEKKALEEKLARWRSPESEGKRRANKHNFSVKCLGVWDTVGKLGLPEEITVIPRKSYNIFGFPDRILGEHVEHAFQALALNEMRVDFDCNKFIQSEAGKLKHQTLKQCWFSGCHSDVGGGYKHHDLADLALIWMAAQVEKFLSLDIDYLENILQPVAPWGTQKPHNSATGIFMLANTVQRTLPAQPHDPETHESFHPSVLQQTKLSQSVSETLTLSPDFVAPLSPLEEYMKKKWPYDPDSPQAKAYTIKVQRQAEGKVATAKTTSWVRSILRSVSSSSTTVNQKVTIETSRERRRTIKTSLDIFSSIPRGTQRPRRN